MMSIEKSLSCIRNSLVIFSICLSAITKATVVDITAEYKPDISDLSHNKFVNTTRVSGPCSRWPGLCPKGTFSIQVSELSLRKRVIQETGAVEDTVAVRLDARFRDVLLTNETGESINAKFRLLSLAQTRRRVAGGENAVVWLNDARGGCGYSTAMGGPSWVAQLWTYPESHRTCYLAFKVYGIESDYLFDEIGFGYELIIAESPIGLGDGIYEGEVVYTLDNGGDIDFYANDYDYSDDEVRFRITATVEHAFNMQFPAGSNRIQLEPSGGWGQWLNSGRMPAKMERNVDFSLTTSGPVSIALQCEREMGTNCALRNQNTGEKVELETRVTLPGLTPLGGGAEVKDYRLATGPIKQFFTPEAYSYKRQSTVHFRVNQPHVETMLKQPGSQWAGNVTLMFEAGL